MLKAGNREFRKLLFSKLLDMTIHKPNTQRIVNRSKVKEIVDYQLKHIKDKKNVNFLGVINIHFLEQTKEYYLVDGQHRYFAITDLYNKYSHDLEVVVEVVNVSKKEQLVENYNLINKNTPLPDFSEEIDKSIPEKTTIHFQEKYPDVWSDREKARRPNVKFNSFQETLGCVTKQLQGDIDSSAKLIKEVEKINSELSLWDQKEFKNVSEGMYRKAKKINFFLGLLSYPAKTDDGYDGYEWGKMIVEKNKTPPRIPRKRKTPIPRKVKNDSWDIYVGKECGEAYCLVCDMTKINSKNFQAGHIVSEKHGGKVSIDNILPVCGPCNQSMGPLNMREYVMKNYPSNLHRFDKRVYRR